MHKGTAKYVFPGNNTSAGFCSHYQNGIEGLEQVYILKGGPGVGKSTLMRKIGLALLDRGYNVEFWQCSSDNDSLDGIIVPAISVAIIDGTPPHNIDPKYPGAVEEIVDFGANWDNEILKTDRAQIVELTNQISDHFTVCYNNLAKAGDVLISQSDEEAQTLDTNALEKTQTQVVKDVFTGSTPPVRHLFSTAITPNGVVSFKETLFDLANRRWIIFGHGEHAKNLIFEQLIMKAKEKGHFIEVYHPPLAPKSIEMLYIPSLDAIIMDSGIKPPNYSKKTDTLVDCTAFGQELSETAKNKINSLVTEATDQISQAKSLHDKLEQHYIKAMDFDKVDKMGGELFNKILARCNKDDDGAF